MTSEKMDENIWNIFKTKQINHKNLRRMKPECPHCNSSNLVFDGAQRTCKDCHALLDRFMYGPRYEKPVNEAGFRMQSSATKTSDPELKEQEQMIEWLKRRHAFADD